MNPFSGPYYLVGSTGIFVSATEKGSEHWREGRDILPQTKQAGNFLNLLSYMKKYTGELLTAHEILSKI